VRGCRARQTRSFVFVLITVFLSSIEARQLRAAVDRRHKNVSTETAQHTEIPLPRDKEPLRFGSTRASFCRARQNGIDFARQSNEHPALDGTTQRISEPQNGSTAVSTNNF
jgi:hypothetical protein